MGIIERISDAYLEIENRYYDFVERSTALTKIVDKVDRVVPSFLLMLVVAFAVIGTVAFSFQPSYSVFVSDETGLTVENALVSLKSGGYAESVLTNKEGKAFIPNKFFGLTADVSVEKEGYEREQKSASIVQNIAFVLKKIETVKFETSDRTLIVQDMEGNLINKQTNVRFSCSSGNATPQDISNENGLIKFEVSEECGALTGNINADGFKEAGVSLNNERTVVKLEPLDIAFKSSGLIVNVFDNENNPLKEIKVVVYDKDSNPLQEDLTDATGVIVFSIVPGSYIVKAVDESGTYSESENAAVELEADSEKSIELFLSLKEKGAIVCVKAKSGEGAVEKAVVKFFSGKELVATKQTDEEGGAKANADLNRNYSAVVTHDEYLTKIVERTDPFEESKNECSSVDLEKIILDENYFGLGVLGTDLNSWGAPPGWPSDMAWPPKDWNLSGYWPPDVSGWPPPEGWPSNLAWPPENWPPKDWPLDQPWPAPEGWPSNLAWPPVGWPPEEFWPPDVSNWPQPPGWSSDIAWPPEGWPPKFSYSRNSGIINVRVVDEENNPVAFADVFLHKTGVDYFIESGKTGSSGNIEFKNLPQGEYFAVGKSSGDEGKSANAFLKDGLKITLPVVLIVGEGEFQVQVKNENGENLQGVKIKVADARTGEVLFDLNTNKTGATDSVKVKVDKQIYFDLQKDGYYNYRTHVYDVKLNTKQLADIILEKEKSLAGVVNGNDRGDAGIKSREENFTIDLVEILDKKMNEAKVLNDNERYFLKFKARIPDNGFSDIKALVRVGENNLNAENDFAAIKRVLTNAVVERSSAVNEKNNYETPESTSGDAKQILVSVAEEKGIYEFLVEMDVRDANFGDEIKVRWGIKANYAYSDSQTVHVFEKPEKDKLYLRTYKIGDLLCVTNCPEFAYSFTLESRGVGLEGLKETTVLLQDAERKIVQLKPSVYGKRGEREKLLSNANYLVNYDIRSTTDKRIENARIIVSNNNGALQIDKANGNTLVIPAELFVKDVPVSGAFSFNSVKDSSETVISLKIEAQGVKDNNAELLFSVNPRKQMRATLNMSVLVPEVKNLLVVKVEEVSQYTNRAIGPLKNAIVSIDISNGFLNPANVFSDENGLAVVNLPEFEPGTIVYVRVKKAGYETKLFELKVKNITVKLQELDFSCVLLDKNVASTFRPGSVKYTLMNTCDSKLDFQMAKETTSDVSFYPKSFSLNRNESKTVKVLTGEYLGEHPVYFMGKYSDSLNYQLAKEAEMHIDDPNSCFKIDKTAYDLAAGELNGKITNRRECFAWVENDNIPSINSVLSNKDAKLSFTPQLGSVWIPLMMEQYVGRNITSYDYDWGVSRHINWVDIAAGDGTHRRQTYEIDGNSGMISLKLAPGNHVMHKIDLKSGNSLSPITGNLANKTESYSYVSVGKNRARINGQNWNDALSVRLDDGYVGTGFFSWWGWDYEIIGQKLNPDCTLGQTTGKVLKIQPWNVTRPNAVYPGPPCQHGAPRVWNSNPLVVAPECVNDFRQEIWPREGDYTNNYMPVGRVMTGISRYNLLQTFDISNPYGIKYDYWSPIGALKYREWDQLKCEFTTNEQDWGNFSGQGTAQTCQLLGFSYSCGTQKDYANATGNGQQIVGFSDDQVGLSIETASINKVTATDNIVSNGWVDTDVYNRIERTGGYAGTQYGYFMINKRVEPTYSTEQGTDNIGQHYPVGRYGTGVKISTDRAGMYLNSVQVQYIRHDPDHNGIIPFKIENKGTLGKTYAALTVKDTVKAREEGAGYGTDFTQKYSAKLSLTPIEAGDENKDAFRSAPEEYGITGIGIRFAEGKVKGISLKVKQIKKDCTLGFEETVGRWSTDENFVYALAPEGALITGFGAKMSESRLREIGLKTKDLDSARCELINEKTVGNIAEMDKFVNAQIGSIASGVGIKIEKGKIVSVNLDTKKLEREQRYFSTKTKTGFTYFVDANAEIEFAKTSESNEIGLNEQAVGRNQMLVVSLDYTRKESPFTREYLDIKDLEKLSQEREKDTYSRVGKIEFVLSTDRLREGELWSHFKEEGWKVLSEIDVFSALNANKEYAMKGDAGFKEINLIAFVNKGDVNLFARKLVLEEAETEKKQITQRYVGNDEVTEDGLLHNIGNIEPKLNFEASSDYPSESVFEPKLINAEITLSSGEEKIADAKSGMCVCKFSATTCKNEPVTCPTDYVWHNDRCAKPNIYCPEEYTLNYDKTKCSKTTSYDSSSCWMSCGSTTYTSPITEYSGETPKCDNNAHIFNDALGRCSEIISCPATAKIGYYDWTGFELSKRVVQGSSINSYSCVPKYKYGCPEGYRAEYDTNLRANECVPQTGYYSYSYSYPNCSSGFKPALSLNKCVPVTCPNKFDWNSQTATCNTVNLITSEARCGEGFELKDGQCYPKPSCPEKISLMFSKSRTKESSDAREGILAKAGIAQESVSIAEEKFHIKLSTDKTADACLGADGRVGKSGKDAVPKVRYTWLWPLIDEKQCDADNPDYIYCDAVQFNIELAKKLNNVRTSLDYNKTVPKSEDMHFQAYLMKDGYASSLLKDFQRYYASVAALQGVESWFVESKEGIWNYYNDETRMAFEVKDSINKELASTGRYQVDIEAEFDNANDKRFFVNGEMNAKINVVLKLIEKEKSNNPLYGIPFDGDVKGRDGGRDGYGIGYASGSDLVELSKEKYDIYSELVETDSISGLKEVSVKRNSDFKRMNKDMRGIILKASENSIEYSPSNAVPVAMEIKEGNNEAFAHYCIREKGKYFDEEISGQSWLGEASNLGDAVCKDPSGGKLFKTGVNKSAASDDIKSVGLCPDDKSFGFAWIPSQKNADLWVKTMFYVPISTDRIIEVLPATSSAVRPKIVSNAGRTDNFNTGIEMKKRTNDIDSLKNAIDLVEKERACVGVNEKNELEIWWNEDNVFKDLGEVSTNKCTFE